MSEVLTFQSHHLPSNRRLNNDGHLKDLEDLAAQKLSLKKKKEELNAKVLSLEKDQEFYKEMILTANRKVERLEQHDWREMGENQNAMAIECLADDELLSQAHPEKANVSNLVRFGKSHTMTGPRVSEVSEEEWGVNHQALNDLFQLCEDRRHSFKYEIQVQFYEIYNEKLRDLSIGCPMFAIMIAF
ncbi:kinesin-like protein KIN-14J [Tanacetum coccineum]